MVIDLTVTNTAQSHNTNTLSDIHHFKNDMSVLSKPSICGISHRFNLNENINDKHTDMKYDKNKLKFHE